MTKFYLLPPDLSFKVYFQWVCVGWQLRPIYVRAVWERVLLGQNLIFLSVTVSGWWGELPSRGILVLSGCYNKIPQTWWLINSRQFIYCPQSWRPKIRVVVWSWAGPPPGSFLLWPHVKEETWKLSGASPVRALIPFLRASPSQPNHLPKAHLLTPSQWALETAWWYGGHIQSLAGGTERGMGVAVSSCCDLRQLLDLSSFHIFKFKSFLKMNYQTS